MGHWSLHLLLPDGFLFYFLNFLTNLKSRLRLYVFKDSKTKIGRVFLSHSPFTFATYYHDLKSPFGTTKTVTDKDNNLVGRVTTVERFSYTVQIVRSNYEERT